MTGEPVVSSGPVSPVDRLDLDAVEAAVRALESEEWSANLPVYNLAETVLAAAGMPALVAEVKRLRGENENLRVRVEMRRPLCRCQPPSCTERDAARAAVERVRELAHLWRQAQFSPVLRECGDALARALDGAS